MRRFVILLGILWCLFGVPVTSQAQPNPLQGPQNITVQDAGACATVGACASFPMNNFITGAVDVSGTFTGTLTPEILVNASWVPVTLYDATGSPFTTITVPGAYSLANSGFARVRLRAGTFASGTAVVWLRQGFFMARASGTFPSGSVVTVTIPNIVTTSTDGMVIRNPTLATVGVPVQISPRLRFEGQAWDTDDAVSRPVRFAWDLGPVSGVTVGGQLTMRVIDPITSAVTGPFFINQIGNVNANRLDVATGSVLGPVSSGATGFIGASNGAFLYFTADGQVRLDNNASTSGVGLDFTTANTLKCRSRTFAADCTFQAGATTLSGTLAVNASTTFGASNVVFWNTRTVLESTNDGHMSLENNGQTIGSRIKVDALPSVSACGAGSPAVVAGSTALSGAVTIGTGAVATCTITFNGTAYPSAAHCSGVVETTTAANVRAMGYSSSTTVLTIVPSAAWVDSSVVNWNCWSPK